MYRLHTLTFLVVYSHGILDGKQTVECDFEDEFMCGYTTSKVGTMSWKRVSGMTISRSTYDERGTRMLLLYSMYLCFTNCVANF